MLQRFAAAVRQGENLQMLQRFAAAVCGGVRKCCSAGPRCSAVLQRSAVVRNECCSAMLQRFTYVRNCPRMLQQTIAVKLGAQSLQSMLFSHTYMLD
jgi:hypothetical protein